MVIRLRFQIPGYSRFRLAVLRTTQRVSCIWEPGGECRLVQGLYSQNNIRSVVN